MKNWKRKIAIFLAAVMMLPGSLSTAVVVSAAEPVETAETSATGIGEVLYTPNMSSMDEFTTYTGPNAGNWTANNGTIRIDNGNGNKALSDRRDFTDFVYEADITVNGRATNTNDTSSMQGGIIFRATNPSNGADSYNGYYFCINASGDQVVLGRAATSGTVWYEIASKRMNIEEDKSYHVTITAYGDHITCSVDDNTSASDDGNYAKIDVVDSTYTTGGIGMRNWLADVSYQNLKVSAYTEPDLAEEDSYVNGQWSDVVQKSADPDILYHDGIYYLYPTNAGDVNDDTGIKVYTSTDLVHWADKGWALQKGDDIWGTANFWAPDVIERDGVFYMYYVANEQTCVATSDSPLGPFTQDVKEPMDTATSTYTDSREIDAHIFYDEASGKYYFYCVRFTNGNAIWGAELNDDMKSIKKDTLKLIVQADQGWDQDMGNINEGPFMLVKDGKYYMTYSGAHFQSIKYGSGYAVSDSPLGTYTKYAYNPIMQSNTQVHGAGHHCITTSPDGTELFMVYHRHNSLTTTEPRQLCIDRMRFTTDAAGNTVLEVNGPTLTEQALPSGAVNTNTFIEIADVESISIPAGTAAEDLSLPQQVSLHTNWSDSDTLYYGDVSWDTSNYDPAQITNVIKGTVTLPDDIPASENAVLTTEITVQRAKTEDETLKSALDAVIIRNADEIRGNITLPEESNGIALTWKSSNEDIISTEVQKNENYYDTPAGVVTRQEKDTKVTLTVSGTYNGETLEREIEVTVLAKPQEEKYVGYLYAHFNEFPGQKSQEQIYYGISTDGLYWTALNDNKAIVSSTVGDNATRDPYIVRSPEGDKFYLICTDQTIYRYGDNIQWDRLSTEGSTALTIWESTDLVNWTNQRNIDVAGSIDGGNAWAPETIYDEATGEYLVYWASKVAADNYARQYMWVAKTRDFWTFTEPQLFNSVNMSNIDTSMFKEGDTYYKLVKQEGSLQNVVLYKSEGHLLAYGDEVKQTTIGNKTYNELGGIYTKINNSASGALESFTGHYEGATMFKFNDREEWCIMVDEYGGATRGYIPFTTTDLNEPNSVVALDDSEYMMQDGGKHGVMLPITQEEYDALIAAYGVEDGVFAAMEEQDAPVLSYDFENYKDGAVVVEPVEGTEHDMTLNGTATVRTSTDTNSNALYLDGTRGTFAALPVGLFDNMEELTISMDVKPMSTEVNHVDFSIGQDMVTSDPSQYLFLRFRNNEITAGVTVRSWQNEKNLVANPDGCLDEWVHVDIVVDGHKMSFYVDNVLIGTRQVRSITELGAGLESYLGKSMYPADPYFTGYYDNIKFYNRALTMVELGAAEPLIQTLEAENAELTGLAKAVTDGYTGNASGGTKVGTIDNTDSKVIFKLNAPAAGTYKIDIIAGGDPGAFPNPSHRYWVNDNESEAQIIRYTQSNGWNNWKTYTIEVELEEGENTFTLSHTGEANSFAELDCIVFYSVNLELDVTLDGEALEGFDMNTSVYEVDVEDLSDLPKLEVSVNEGLEEDFDVVVTQATKDRPEAYVTVASTVDKDYVKEYTIRFLGPDTFTNPLLNFGADPHVTYHDGYYYYVKVMNDQSIWVTKSDDLTRIGKVEPVKVYEPSGDEPAYQLWAPEIHFIDGSWYIYYAACSVNNNSYHRMQVVKCSEAQGQYEYVGSLAPTTNKWAIDQTVLEYNDKLYAIWSGWEGDVDGEQRLYIAEMSDPTTIVGERVVLSIPEYSWEVNQYPHVNEGAQIAIAPDGTVNVVYSASGSWSDFYCLGMLTLKDGGDPMNPEDWIKGGKPIFQKNDSTTFSTGHACFVQSPDGTETYLVYHANRGSGDGWNGRGPRLQRVYWNEDGTPFIGTAVDYDGRVNMPSGTPDTEYVKVEAESATLNGAVSVKETYNSSSGKKVTGLRSANDSAVLTFDVETAGTYKLYVGAATGNNNAALSVKVNDGEAVSKTIYPFNMSTTGNVIGDNWFGYELEVEFVEGENTVAVGGTGVAVDFDYIEYTLLEAKEPVKPVDKSVLEETVQNATEKLLPPGGDSSVYTEESWELFINAFEAAEAVLEDEEATQEEVDAAATALQAAVDGIELKEEPPVPPEVDKSALEAAVAAEREAALDAADYTEDTWKEYAEALEAAEALLEDEEATQEAVDAAVAALSDAKEGLKLLGPVVIPVDKTALQEAVDESEALKAEEYTEKTWEAYQAVLADAKEVLADAEATQDEVDEAVETLEAAAELLRLKLPYVDVAETDWFYEAVYYNYFAKTMTGMDETHFGPYGQLSRAQFALILYRIEGEPEVDTDKSFFDIAGDEWYGPAVLWAAEAGIVTGYQSGHFGPADMITREQMAVMMYRYANYLKQDTSSDANYDEFLDAASVSEFATDAMKWVVDKGIITGKNNGTKLDPQGNTARCEAAAIIQRFMK